MSSPFVMFRRHQRILMVVITGLSMISFVLLGAVQDPSQLPVPMIIVFIASLVGGVAWLAGLGSGKATEWGLTGAAAGAVIALAIAYSSREASAVYIDNGNLSAEQVSQLRSQRYVVNQFVNMAFQQTFSMPLQSMPAAIQRNYMFGFSNTGDVSVDDVVVGEILRREADKMGIVISDKVVADFIKQVTSKEGLTETFERHRGQMNPQEAAMWSFYLPQIKEKPMTAQTFTKLRQTLRISETGLLDAIRDELKIRQAYQLLAGNNYFPPEQFWQYYQKLNVKQSAEIATIPVKDFINPDAQPTEADLVKLFEKYRQNFPGFTPEGTEEPGRPGFYQPRRFQLGYLEADYEKIEPLVGEVSDEEIQKVYQDQYLKAVPAGMSAPVLDGPDLPPAPSQDRPAMPAPGDQPAKTPPAPAEKATEKPADKSGDTSEKTPEKPATPTEKSPAKNGASQPADAPKSEQPKATPEEKKPAAEKPAAESKPADVPASDSNSSLLKGMSATQPVAFLADETDAPAEKPAADAPKIESPASEKPTAEKPATEKPDAEKPAAEKPATPAAKDKKDAKPEDKAAEKSVTPPAPEKPAPAGEMKANATAIPPAPGENVPAAPKNEVPPLDDALKAQIRADILKERTQEEIQKRIDAAYLAMADISTDVTREKTEQDYLTLEEATQKLKAYAEAHQLIYVVTPMLSYEDLANSEEHPIGEASLPQRMSVADAMANSAPTDLYRVNTASNFNTSSSYVFWKLQDKAAYPPVSLDDEPGLREQVTEAWNLEQARPKAKARAEALAKMVRESEQPMGTVLAEQTVTGNKESLFVPVRITGEFTWMQSPIVPSTSMMQSMPVRPSVIPGAPDAGEEFYQKVFEDLNVGDVGIAPGNDHTNFYVVKIESRNPSTPEEMEELRKKFLEEGMQVSGYSSLLQQSLMENSVNWLQQLFDEHGVKIMQRD